MTVVLRYTEPIIQQAIRHYLRRVYWQRFVQLNAFVLLIIVIVLYVEPVRNWTLLTIPVVVIPALFIAGYFMGIRDSSKKLGLLNRGSAMLTLSEHGIQLQSAMGRTEIDWDHFSGLWNFQTLYLLLLTSHQFITLPKDQVSDEFIDFVRAHVGKQVKI